MTDPDGRNAFESDMPPTAARTKAEATVEQLRVRGGVFVEAVRATRMAMVLTDPALPGNPIIFANESFLALSGYDADEVLGQQPYFLNGPDTHPRDAARFRQALVEDHDETLQSIQYRKDGSRMVVSLFLTALKDDDGRTLHHLLSWRDISRQTAAEEEVNTLQEAQAALRESEARNSLLIGSWAQAVWETDPHGVVIVDSPSWRAYTGQTFQEWLGYGWLDAIHPDDRAYAERQWREATAAQGLVNAEFRLRAADGGWRWTNVRAAPVLDAKGDIEKWTGMNIDVDARKRAEAALNDSEERQAFQLQLSDALASLSDPAEIQAAAARLVAGQLGVGWCYFNEFDDRGTHATVLGDFHRDGLPSMVGVHDLSGERDFLDLMRSEALLDMPDLNSSELFSAQAKAAYGALGIRSALGAPLLRNGRLAAVLLVADTEVRRWARGDSELLRGVAERTWAAIERSRAERARVKADQSFTRLFEASPAPFLVLAPHPPQFTITEVNDAYLAATMRTREELVGRALFDAFPENPNETKPTGASRLRASLEHVLASRKPDGLPGLRYDIPHSDGTFEERWWSPVNSPILDEEGKVEAIIHNANDVTEDRRAEAALRESERYKGLLLAELQHRVRNILTMVRSVARRTADNAEDVEDYVRHLDGRLAALARVQTILTRGPGEGVNLYDLVLDELTSQATLPAQYDIAGPEIALSAKAAEVLSLAVHELATNSTKYGVLGDLNGTIRIRWTIDDRDGRNWLCFTWSEPIDPKIERPVRTGFGSELIRNRVPYELRGTGDIRIGTNEVEAKIDFPLASEQGKSLASGPQGVES